jgi:hypothetical protein
MRVSVTGFGVNINLDVFNQAPQGIDNHTKVDIAKKELGVHNFALIAKILCHPTRPQSGSNKAKGGCNVTNSLPGCQNLHDCELFRSKLIVTPTGIRVVIG